MLTLNNLQVSYGKNVVLQDLNLALEKNRVHGLVGLNGSGKTTLFNAMYKLHKPDRGSIEWDGNPIDRKQFAYLETDNFFYSNITAREHLNLFNPYNQNFNVEIWQQVLHLPLDDLIESYSTGMKKKLAILSILKLDKEILLLDEPFNEVDLETSRIIKLLLEKLINAGKTILVSSHIMETLTNSCDYIHHLENQCIKKSYSKNEYADLEQDLFERYDKQLKSDLDKLL